MEQLSLVDEEDIKRAYMQSQVTFNLHRFFTQPYPKLLLR